MICTMSCPAFWGDAISGLVIVLLVSLFLLGWFVWKVHPFLAKNAPINADILVVEGWLPDYALKAAINEFEQRPYQALVTIGGSIPRGFFLSEYKTFAELAGATLIALNFDPEKLVVIADDITPLNPKLSAANRTHDSAIKLQTWFTSFSAEATSMNLFTLGTHARRSWILFKKVFEPRIRVGIISAQPLHYDPAKWWASSEGNRTIIAELLAYIFMRLFRVS
jgi:hypothetical protein